VLKEIFGDFPPGAQAGPGRFLGGAAMGGRTARWDLAIAGRQERLRPLRPAVLYRAPLPRTKLEASVPDGLVTGTLVVEGRTVDVSRWRGTVGHNWGSEHADSWVWLHAAGFAEAPDGWLELVLARIRVGRTRLPWTAMGALSLGDGQVPLGGLGRRPLVIAQPARLTAGIPSPGARLKVTVKTAGEDAVAVAYANPSGGNREVRHAARATVELTWQRRNEREVVLSGLVGAYEYGTSQGLGPPALEPLPEG
jgi:hypothetical protein